MSDGQDVKCIAYMSVYGKNRVFRLPGNCKLGDSVPIARISGDPSNGDLTATFEQNKYPSCSPTLELADASVECIVTDNETSEDGELLEDSACENDEAITNRRSV